MSLTQIAKELGITPAYLSYMVNGKRPWRQDLYERYCQLVNTTVNIEAESVNKKAVNAGNANTNKDHSRRRQGEPEYAESLQSHSGGARKGAGGNGWVRTIDLALMKRPLCH